MMGKNKTQGFRLQACLEDKTRQGGEKGVREEEEGVRGRVVRKGVREGGGGYGVWG